MILENDMEVQDLSWTKKEKLIVEGNALYEIDMECVEHKKDRMRDMKNGGFRKKRRDTERKAPGR